MSCTSFAHDWQNHFPKAPPLNYLLRTRYPKLWTRFHALPESKRYAETQVERKIILDRAVEIAGYLFGNGQEIWVATCRLNYESSPGTTTKILPRLATALGFEFSRDESVFFEEPVEVEVSAVKAVWQPCQFDMLLGEIAENRENAIWFDPVSGRILAPYDGGFDIFLENGQLVADIEHEFGLWMSDLDCKL